MDGKTLDCLRVLVKRGGPVKSFHATTNHDTGERDIKVKHENGKMSVILTFANRIMVSCNDTLPPDSFRIR